MATKLASLALPCLPTSFPATFFLSRLASIGSSASGSCFRKVSRCDLVQGGRRFVSVKRSPSLEAVSESPPVFSRRVCCVGISVAASVSGRTSDETKQTMAVAAEVVVDTPKAPVAKKVSHVMEMHGDKREDNYYWIRDDDRKDPDVLAYLNEENAYTEALMEGACWSPCVLILYMHRKMPQRPSPDHCILYLKDCAVACCACFWSPLHMYFLRDMFVEDQLLCCTFAPVRLLCTFFS